MQEWLFSFVVVGLSRLMIVRDRLLGRLKGGLRGGVQCAIPSGGNVLDAALMLPAGEPRAAMLICHGIGETVEHWPGAQALMAERGAASLVFNYSAMGRSSGRFSAAQCERDALAACAWLRTRLPGVPITLLGFSLGSGVASAVVTKLDVAGLVLCEAYTSFREAASRMGLPPILRGVFPDRWRNVEALRLCRVPVLIVHGECDRLFPVTMGRELAAACAGRLAIVPAMGHADLHQTPRREDWAQVMDWVPRV
jgi:pimeloyl-ACP methyl ester carboxylesterase